MFRNITRSVKSKSCKTSSLRKKLLCAAVLPLMLGAAATQANAYTISGTVFRSPGGLPLTNPNGSLHGTPSGLIGGQPIYLYIINQAKVIIAKTQVNANGSYAISGLTAGLASAAQLASTSYAIGGTIAFVGLPSDYYAVGEGETASGDLNPDYSYPLAQTTDITVNFGFEERPGSTNVILSNFTFTNGRLNIPATAFNGADPEDGIYLNNLAGRTVDFYAPTPAGSTFLYYYDTLLNFSGMASTFTIENFNPTKVSLAFNGATSTRGFSYTVADNAGARPYVPATIVTTSPLMVALASFNGRWQESAAVINWATASEKTNDYFILERSADGAHFQSIERIASRAANGNSDAPLSYSYTDLTLAKTGLPDAYYRLRSVDKSGIASLSRIIRVNTGMRNEGPTSSFTIFPNPAVDYLNITSAADLAGATQAILTNAMGNTLQKLTLSGTAGTVTRLDLAGIPNGQYFLTITNADGSLLTKQLTLMH